MLQFNCMNCGSHEYTISKNKLVCCYCRTNYYIEKANHHDDTRIDLLDDISRLVSKCISEPHNAKRYSEIILEMDPYNRFAKHYLKK